jgi:hypothetical protein
VPAAWPARPYEAATELIPPVETTAQIRALPRHGTPARPGGAPVAHDGATQFIPPVRAEGPDGATQFIPRVRADDAEDATRFIPPVRAEGPEGATRFIPPVRAEGPDGATQFIPRVRAQDPEATTQLRAYRAPAAAGETQALPPVPADDEGDFDRLFRANATAGPRQPPPPPAPARHGGGRDGRSPALIAAAVVVGCALVGLIAGAALSGGGDQDGDLQQTASTAPETETGTEAETETGTDTEAGTGTEPEAESTPEDDGSAEAAAQAGALSRLLEDSNNSRDSVVESVTNIRSCRHLNRAAADLRAAAEQRDGLVTRLDALELDQIPEGDALAQSLAEAWRASAEADEHYAAWADEARGDRRGVCPGGEARHTDRATQGDAASGRATQAKERAADLWNPVAGEHGLPERTAAEL